MPSLQVTRSVIYPNEIDRILKMPGGPVGKVVRRLALDIADEAEREAKIATARKSPFDQPRTGRYVRSFAVKVQSNATHGFEFVVSNTAPYAAVLEEGSRPHIIAARKAKFLRFRDRRTGQWRTVKAVFHPGLGKGWHILREAMFKVVRASIGTGGGVRP